MPTVSVFQDALQAALGGDCSEAKFDELCFEFGLELDEVTSEKEIVSKERGQEAAEGLCDRIIFKIDVPANRYDLLCIEGLVMALKVFQGQAPVPVYTLNPQTPRENLRCTVMKSAAAIRPYIVCAVLRGVTFTEDRYKSFIDLQDKLHQNVCRRRTLVSMGTHDLSTIKAPFTYEALPPKDIRFVPLSQDREMDGNEMMEVLSKHQQLKAYLPIIRDSPVYPVVFDANRVVCSLPPIINGEHSKIKLSTRDVFIECTATDMTKAHIACNTLVAMFSQHCDKPFEVEPVEVIYADDYPANEFTKGGDKMVTPKVAPREMKADIARMQRSLNLPNLSAGEMQTLLQKMSVPCSINKGELNVQVPISRSDIMHECDLVEDLAIAYGYNNFGLELPGPGAPPREQPINHLTDLLRQELAMAGFTECLNWALVSNRENFSNLRSEVKEEDLWRTVANEHEYLRQSPAVNISNPKTKEFEIVRTSIMPGVLKTLCSNKHNPMPIKLFEIGDVVLQEPTKEVGSKNVRRACVMQAETRSNFESVHGALDQLMFALNCEPEHSQEKGSKRKAFKLSPSEDPAFFPGMQAHIVVEGVNIGVIGVLHPDVVGPKGFEVNCAVTGFELTLDPFVEWL